VRSRFHGNPDGAPTDHARDARSLLLQAQTPRLGSIPATNLLILPFPQEPPASTLAGPPGELTCLNSDVGVADSGGSETLPDTPTRSSTGNVSRDGVQNGDLYPTVILAVVDVDRSQIVHRLSK
jgi:hypothetical protein